MPAIHMAKSPVVVVDVTVNLLKRWSRSVRYSGLVRVTLLITSFTTSSSKIDGSGECYRRGHSKGRAIQSRLVVSKVQWEL